LSRDTRGTNAPTSITLLRRALLARFRYRPSIIGYRYGETAILRAYFFSENSQALRATSSRRELTISHDEPRHNVALGAWTVPP